MIRKKVLSKSLKKPLSDSNRVIVPRQQIQPFLPLFDLPIHSHSSLTITRIRWTPLPYLRLQPFTSTQNPRTTGSKQAFWLRKRMALRSLQQSPNFPPTPTTHHYERLSLAKLGIALRSIMLKRSLAMSRQMTVAIIPAPSEKTHGNRTRATQFASIGRPKEPPWQRPLLPILPNIEEGAPLHLLGAHLMRTRSSPRRTHAVWSKAKRRTQERAYSAHVRHLSSSILPSVEPRWAETEPGIPIMQEEMSSD